MSENDEKKPMETPQVQESAKVNQTKQTKKKHRGRASRTIGKWIKRLIVLAILIVAGLFLLKSYIQSQAGDTETTEYSRAVVTRGAMEETVYGTGTTTARNQPNVLAEADGTLTDLRMSVGDAVNAGDILAVMTNADLDDEITDLEFQIWDLDSTILGTAAGSSQTIIEAPAAGRVVAIYAQAGDDALAVFRREGALAIISTDGRMKVELEEIDTRAGVQLNDTVSVLGEGFAVEGTVTDLTRQGTYATITILNDTLPLDAAVQVRTEDGVNIGTGLLKVNKPMAVSSYGGTVQSVRVTTGQKVSRRDTLFRMTDSPLSLTIEDLRLQRETASKSLADAKAQRENLIVVAPCDGTIATLDVSEGDEITSGTLLCSILQGEDMNLTIAVDELDVVEVEAGQKVIVSIDALSGLELTGEVYKIAPVGTNSGGVTTYDVELTFEAAGTGVRSGMNATGEIVVASKDDTLYVPIEAIMTIRNESYVMVADANPTVSTMGLASLISSAAAEGMPSGERPSGMSGNAPDGAAGRSRDTSASADGTAQAGRTGSTAQGTDSAASTVQGTGSTAGQSTGFLDGLMGWLYEGVETSTQVTGTLVKVSVGMQNDDYAEILDGVSEGDVVLYTSSSTTTTNGYGMNSYMGGMRF